jgi:hypothetical protein
MLNKQYTNVLHRLIIVQKFVVHRFLLKLFILICFFENARQPKYETTTTQAMRV